MSGQVADTKFILDATAGFRMMWFNKHHPNCIYLDQRPECEPDIVGDFRDLKQFPNETFRLIVFDPPHIIVSKKNTSQDSSMRHMFGVLVADTIEEDMKKAFSEFWRVLKPYGVLMFKWNTQYLQSDRLLALAPCPPLVYQVSASIKRKETAPLRRANYGSQAKTLWFCFMKIPEGGRV
jgi:SAM-dependent methyltransferase